jgi:hypothetical protein
MRNKPTNLLSRAQQVEEIIKCGKDPVYFIKNYVKIQHPTRGTIPFETYPFQDDCVQQFKDNRHNIILKSRQLGLSTLCAAYVTWMAIFHKDKNILIIATKLPTAMNMIKKVKVALLGLPPWLLLTKFEPTKQAVSFDNGSQIVAVPTSDDAGRSEALSLLVVDEAAIIHNFDEIWTGLAPTISTGGDCIVLSTPKGVGGQYYRLWTQAQAGQNDFNCIKLPWTVHPEHDDAWFVKETKSLSRKRASQEYLCDFISSGDTFLQPSDLEDLRTKIQEPIDKQGHDRNIWIWEHPNAGHTYVVSADVARGDAADYSAFHVIDASTCEVVAEYMGKVPPEKLADMLAEWGQRYNGALLVPENNTFGYFVNTKLRDVHSYKKLYYDKNKGDPFNYIPTDPNELPGFPTNQKSRVQILAKLEELIRNKALSVYSERLYNQLQAFVWNGNKPSAGKDSHDDLIMSLAIGCWLIEGGEGISEQAKLMAYAMLEATRLHRNEQMPGNINEAQPLINPNIRGYNESVFRPKEASQVQRTNPFLRDVGDFSWLMG